jgi:hypothetical protein
MSGVAKEMMRCVGKRNGCVAKQVMRVGISGSVCYEWCG